MLHFAAEPIGGKLKTSEETMDVGYFSRHEISLMDLSEFNRQQIEDGFDLEDAPFIRDNVFLWACCVDTEKIVNISTTP